jgi:5-methylcytosine-specific restriction endonuclease McrA
MLNRFSKKRPRLRLEPGAYLRLRREVLERDGWRRQCCGRMENLEVHPLQARSQWGDDDAENLIVLCAECHRKTHERTLP